MWSLLQVGWTSRIISYLVTWVWLILLSVTSHPLPSPSIITQPNQIKVDRILTKHLSHHRHPINFEITSPLHLKGSWHPQPLFNSCSGKPIYLVWIRFSLVLNTGNSASDLLTSEWSHRRWCRNQNHLTHRFTWMGAFRSRHPISPFPRFRQSWTLSKLNFIVSR